MKLPKISRYGFILRNMFDDINDIEFESDSLYELIKYVSNRYDIPINSFTEIHPVIVAKTSNGVQYCLIYVDEEEKKWVIGYIHERIRI